MVKIIGSRNEKSVDVYGLEVALPDGATKGKAFPFIPMEPVKFRFNADAVPKKNPYYHVPIHLERQVRENILEMERMEIVERVENPEWVSPMRVVPKGSNSFRICIDLREPNDAMERDPWPMPTIDKSWCKLTKAKVFTKLDLKSACHHVRLHKSVRKFTAFLTDIGTFQFKRLAFGMKVAPELFQKTMEQMFKHLSNFVVIFLDDILIHAETVEDLRKRTAEVMKVIEANNLTLNKDKCEYEKTTIDFLGCTIGDGRVRPTKERIQKLADFPVPNDKKSLLSFLGLVTFVSSFIHNCSNLTALLRELTKKDVKFEWKEEHQKAFDNLKKEMVWNIRERGFFDVRDETLVYTDASPDAIGCVLVQRCRKSRETRIISCLSRSLTSAERNYNQHIREGLAIVWGVEKNYYYLLGGSFTLFTDASAYEYIFGDSKHNFSNRLLQRSEGYALRLSPYSFKVKVVKSEENIADPLSRILENKESEAFRPLDKEPHEIFSVSVADVDAWSTEMSISSEAVKEQTLKDHELQKVMKFVEEKEKTNGNGKDEKDWPKEIRQFQWVSAELFTVDGLLFKSDKLVLPKSLREVALKIAHRGHPGMTTMRQILRKGTWWPGMDGDADRWVQKCMPCQRSTRQRQFEPVMRMPMPERPWEVVGIDFLTPESNWHVLVAKDYYSRYMIAVPMTKTDTEATTQALAKIFRIFGCPRIVMSDNGPPFSCPAFAQ